MSAARTTVTETELSRRGIRKVRARGLRAAASASALAVALAVLAGVAVPPPTHAQEIDRVAATLLDSGREALSKRDYDAAIEFFDKALEEDGKAVEAVYWKAQALEKLGRRRDALVAYRGFLSLVEAGGAASAKSHADLVTKAEAREKRLGEGERALDRLNAAFAKKVLAFARKHAEDDPALARRAAQAAVAADPSHSEAADLLAELGGAEGDDGDGPPPEGPFKRFVDGDWHDFIARKTLGTDRPEYVDGRMSLNVSGGKLLGTTERVRLAKGYLFESYFRIQETHARGWLTGLAFARGGDEFWVAMYKQGQLILNRGSTSRGPIEDVDDHPLPAQRIGTWHRLGVRVDGARIQVWLDGRIVIDHDTEDPESTVGDLALFQQRCSAEYRLLRAGRAK